MNTIFSFMNTIVWDVNPGFDLWIIQPRWYGLLFALCFIAGYLILEKIYKIENKSIIDLDSLTIYMVVSTVIGARLGHCLFYSPEYYLSNPLEILMIWHGGLASHGATIGVLIGIYFYIKKNTNCSYLWILDRIAVAIPLGGALVRIGNFFNSEIVGHPSNAPWAIIFKQVDSIPRHPVQLYESFAYLIVFSILYSVYQKYKTKTPQGLILGLLFILLFSARMIVEIWKTQQVSFELNTFFSMGQLLSIPFILIGIFLVFRSFGKK